MKYFLVELTECNGEQEYSHNIIIESENEESARIDAENYAKTFYDDDNVTEDDGMCFFFNGSINVCIDSITEMSMEDIKEYLWNAALVQQRKQ